MEKCIRDLLERWGLSHYSDVFLLNGYDDINIIRGINEGDLKAMGIACQNETRAIVDTLAQCNDIFMTYMSVDELNCRPSSEEVLNRVADKLEKEGVLPSGQDIVSVVLEKLKSEQVLLHPYNKQMYITKEGHESTRREYNILRARFAQELFLPNQSVSEALKLIHESEARGQPPPKPPKPKDVPIYDSKTGKLVRVNQENSNYENVNLLYEFIHQLAPFQAPTTALPTRSISQLTLSTQLSAHSGEGAKTEGLRFECTQSEDSSPVLTRTVKKKQTLFKRFKHNLFGKSNSSLESYLASSTKTLISDRSSDCSSSKLGFFYKGKSKKEKQGRLERQRSNSAPEAARNVNLEQIPESVGSQPVYARPYRRPSCTSKDYCRCCGPNDIYSHVFPTRELIQATPLHPTPLHPTPFNPAFNLPTHPPSHPAFNLTSHTQPNFPPSFNLPTHPPFKPPSNPLAHPPFKSPSNPLAHPPFKSPSNPLSHPPFKSPSNPHSHPHFNHPSNPPSHPSPQHSPVKPTKSDTFSDTSLSSGDSAYSSKPCLNAIISSQRPVIYGPLSVNPRHFSMALPNIAPDQPNGGKCSCCSCHDKKP